MVTSSPVGEHGDDVRWAWGLIATALPAAIVALLLVEVVADATRWRSGLALYLAVALPLVASVVVGVRAWRRDRDGLGLRAALLSSGMLVVGTTLVVLTW
ncbi:MAG TPA: hypothetical protein VFR87_16770 [Nocardioidaceae bacterium]|nr:hypothetical protein [Nocardioidaceae bacterium]